MKKFLFILFIFPGSLFAQVDTVSLQKFRLEATIEGAGFYGNGRGGTPVLPWRADVLTNAFKKYGLQDQYGVQLYFFNKFSVELFYSHDQFKGDLARANAVMESSYPGYYIQGQPKNRNDPPDHTDLDLRYLRAGLSANLRLSKSKYLQPYGFFAIGAAAFPDEELAFKDHSSNDFYLNSYSLGKMRTMGCVAGIRYKYCVDGSYSDSASITYWHIGIKVEAAYMNVAGTGKVTSTRGIGGSESVSTFDVRKNFQYITIGAFVGFGLKNKKYAKSFFFSKYPIKKRKGFSHQNDPVRNQHIN
jgi:hypothetical protein